MTTYATADDQPHDPPDAEGFGPPIRRIFRDVIADRLPEDAMPPQAVLLFTERRDRRRHPHARRPRQRRPSACPPAIRPHRSAIQGRDRRRATPSRMLAGNTSSRRPRRGITVTAAVQARTPELLARWSHECDAVRLALAALAVVFPNERTLPALTPRLEGFAGSHADGTDIGDYIRFILVIASQDPDRILHAVETYTDAYWKGTSRAAPLPGRAFHLLAQMLSKVDDDLRTRPIT